METVLRNLAKPYIFLVKEGGLAIILSLLFSTFIYNYYYSIPTTSVLSAVNTFLTSFVNPVSFSFRIILYLILFFLFFFLFNKSFLKILNNALFNCLAITVLLYFLYSISQTAFFIFSGLGLLLLIYKYLIKGGNFYYDVSSNPFGDSRWSTFAEIKNANLAIDNAFILGRDEKTGNIIGFNGEGHVLTVAKTGAGKGVGVVVPNLLNYSGSIIVVDPKGENFIRSVFAREKLFNQEICLIDPFGEVHKQVIRQLKRIEKLEKENKFTDSVVEVKSFYQDLVEKVKPPEQQDDDPDILTAAGIYNKGFNPLQLVEQLAKNGNYQEVFDQANVISNMLVVRELGDSNSHWNDKAKMIIKNTIIFLSLHEEYRDLPLNLILVKDTIQIIFGDSETLAVFTDDCTTSQYSKYLTSIASEFKLMADEERQSVLSFVMRHLEFIDSPLVSNNLVRTDFSLLDIKQVKKTVYLVLPASKLDAYSRLIRLWISSIINAISLDLEPPSERILMIIDEMAQLGKMEPLIQAVSLLRGYGLNLWMIFQDLSQMKSIYGDQLWKTFSSNARVQQFFGISDQDTAEYVSALSGTTTVIKGTQSIDANSNVAQHSFSAEERKLLYPHNLYRTDMQFMFTEGMFPIKARKIKFFEDGQFQVGKHLPFQLRQELKSFF